MKKAEYLLKTVIRFFSEKGLHGIFTEFARGKKSNPGEGSGNPFGFGSLFVSQF